uniref:Serine and arginine rich splicing factor 11 n=1 Tax=Neogobius melanostomus TaxID=47308 RepID=A0A8C6SCA0_9GOBI
MRTLFGFLGTIEELKLFPPDDSPMPVTSRVCFVKFQEQESVGVSQHLTNTVFLDRALIVVPFAEGSIPDESKALSLLAPANAVAGILPGGGLLPTPNPLPNPLGANPFGAPNMDALAAFGFPGANMNPQAADQLLKFMTDPKLNPLAVGLNLSASLKADASNKEIEVAMKRVREAQSLISAAIEPGSKDSKRRHSRSRSRSRRRRSRSRSRHRRTRSRSRRRSASRSRRRSKSPAGDAVAPETANAPEAEIEKRTKDEKDQELHLKVTAQPEGHAAPVGGAGEVAVSLDPPESLPRDLHPGLPLLEDTRRRRSGIRRGTGNAGVTKTAAVTTASTPAARRRGAETRSVTRRGS